MLDTPLMLVELSVMEQRYQAGSAVIHDGVSVLEVARRSLDGHCRQAEPCSVSAPSSIGE